MTPHDQVACLLAALIAGTIAIHVWGTRKERRARTTAVERARTALIDSPATTYGAGAHAAVDGAEMWTNPFCAPGGDNDRAMAWHAGWCYGKQLLRELGGQP